MSHNGVMVLAQEFRDSNGVIPIIQGLLDSYPHHNIRGNQVLSVATVSFKDKLKVMCKGRKLYPHTIDIAVPLVFIALINMTSMCYQTTVFFGDYCRGYYLQSTLLLAKPKVECKPSRSSFGAASNYK